MNRLLKELNLAQKILLPITALLIAYTLYLVFMVVPNERLMGPVQRIFYFHVGSAMAAYLASAIVLLSSVGYLATRKRLYDVAAEASGEVGLLLCSMVLLSGMIWGHSAWNTWWSWEPRLVSFLIMWLIFVGFVFLRSFGDPTKTPAHCAILGIVGALMVPVVIFSIKFLPAIAQMHPQVVENRGLKDPSFVEAMILGMLALISLSLLLICVRMRVGILSREVADARTC